MIMTTKEQIDRLVFVFLTTIRLWRSSGQDCIFPRSWHGRWLEGGKVSLVITSKEFSNKGVCFDQHKDYFLVENRLEHCHRCLLITTRHNNVIEYQQSYCIGRQSLQSICAQILVSGENNFFTLVREAAIPVACPFQKPFHFIYNNNSRCYCRSPMSYLRHCADETRIVFTFKRCRNCIVTADRAATFECLASWENGRDFFAVGAFLDEFSVRETYHCFMYHMYDSVMYIVMATGVTCHGFLRYPKEGQLTMELTEDVYGWPPTSCTFPSWLCEHIWTDLFGVIVYTVSSGNDVMIREERRHSNMARASANGGTSSDQLCTGARTNSKCLKVFEQRIYNDSWRTDDVLVQVLENCETSYHCVRLRYRQNEQSPFLVLMQTSDSITELDNCSIETFAQNKSQILVRQSQEPGPCPFTGRYTSSVDSKGCQLELQSGCRNQSTMTLKSSCQEQPTLQLSCLKWWSVQQKLFLLAMQWNPSQHQFFSCYSFYSPNGTMRISHEENCDFASSESSSDTVYEFNYRLDHCLSSSDGDSHAATTYRLPTIDVVQPPRPPPRDPLRIHDSNSPKKSPEIRDAAKTSPRLNHLSASAFSAAVAASRGSLRLDHILLSPFICLCTVPHRVFRFLR